MIHAVKAFFAFWYDFIVGDDWQVAVAVVLALAGTFWLAATTAIPVWWVLPAAVAVVLPTSLWRAARSTSGTGSGSDTG
ncbi:hypothetical protein LQ327_00735 [Actinomycetospora endophytica]|uniref:Uncharacterized protein n=1 Tax=Actinomycetospora endophytica TaxID=2291215 RepID=A0ABS8P2X2_9PSEU|nr:hypothetical protein [Actinomycetospora endophytica]MCD2191915.1 hypothetical protein [Actinomycetospora endophytica]